MCKWSSLHCRCCRVSGQFVAQQSMFGTASYTKLQSSALYCLFVRDDAACHKEHCEPFSWLLIFNLYSTDVRSAGNASRFVQHQPMQTVVLQGPRFGSASGTPDKGCIDLVFRIIGRQHWITSRGSAFQGIHQCTTPCCSTPRIHLHTLSQQVTLEPSPHALNPSCHIALVKPNITFATYRNASSEAAGRSSAFRGFSQTTCFCNPLQITSAHILLHHGHTL
jgi:hypothetical protein